MDKLKFPILEGNNSSFPDDFVCPVCKENRVGEPHEFAVLSGGAASETGENGEGFLYMSLHPQEDEPFISEELAKQPKKHENGAWLEIVRDTNFGQFDFYFCSTGCLRKFLNSCVDELERKLDEPTE